MLLKRPKAKQFDYTPRYYNPETDPEERRKRKLGFQSTRKARRKVRNPIYWLILVIVVFYLYLKFSGQL